MGADENGKLRQLKEEHVTERFYDFLQENQNISIKYDCVDALNVNFEELPNTLPTKIRVVYKFFLKLEKHLVSLGTKSILLSELAEDQGSIGLCINLLRQVLKIERALYIEDWRAKLVN